MPEAIRILLVSPDLMVGSRVTGLAAGCGAAVDTIPSLAADLPEGAYRVVLLDLQGLRGDAAGLVAQARERLHGAGAPALVAFGPHVAEEALAGARAAGADLVVSRGELLGAFATVLARCRA